MSDREPSVQPGDSFNVEIPHNFDYLIAPKYRPKPSGREVYHHSKRFDARQHRDEEHHDIDWEAAGRAARAVFARRPDEEQSGG